MRNILLLFCGITLFFLSSRAQNQPQTVFKDTLVETYRLKGDTLRLWDSLETIWKKQLPSIFKKHNVLISCTTCTSVIANVVFYADSTGQCKIVQNRKLIFCGGTMSEAFKEDYFNFWLKEVVFPPALRKRYLIARLGVVLKC